MPTVLPPRRRAEQIKCIASILFNGFLLVSALAFAIVVLVREQDYARGQSPSAPFENGAVHAPAAPTE